MIHLLRKKPLRSVWTLMFLVMFCCCSGLFTTWFTAKRTAQAALSAKIKDLQSRRVPFDDDSLSVYHQELNTEENVAEIASLLEYFSTSPFTVDCRGLPVVSTGTSPIPKVGQMWVQQPDVERLLEKHKKQISRLIELTQENGPIRFPIQFNSIDTLLPNTQKIRGAVRVLCLEASVAAHKSDAEREFRAINAMLGCAISIRGEPMLVSQLVSIACCGIARDRLQTAVQSNRLLPQHYERLSNRLWQLSDIGHNYRVGLVGEIGFCATGMTNPNTLKQQIGPLAGLAIQTGLAERAAVRQIEFIESLIEANTENLQEFRQRVEAIERDTINSSSIFNLRERLNLIYSPAATSFADCIIRYRMANDLAILALAIRRYEDQHGHLPESLEKLTEFGIQLENHRASDGSIPLYRLVEPSTVSQSKIRGVIWGFDSQKTKQISPLMPELPNPDQDWNENWVWYLE